VIVLDEPTAGVDVELRQTLWQFIRRLNRDGHTIVLTTHYLEEAQELCGRIAMLKQGQVVALDDTSALLRRFAGGRLQLSLSAAPLPEALAPLRLDEGGQGGEAADVSGAPAGLPQKLALRIDDYAGIEGILAALREGGCRIDEMELQHADLEDVFVQIMKDNR
jgi:ABC-2 type transport system ATP-binding protein